MNDNVDLPDLLHINLALSKLLNLFTNSRELKYVADNIDKYNIPILDNFKQSTWCDVLKILAKVCSNDSYFNLFKKVDTIVTEISFDPADSRYIIFLIGGLPCRLACGDFRIGRRLAIMKDVKWLTLINEKNRKT